MHPILSHIHFEANKYCSNFFKLLTGHISMIYNNATACQLNYSSLYVIREFGINFSTCLVNSSDRRLVTNNNLKLHRSIKTSCLQSIRVEKFNIKKRQNRRIIARFCFPMQTGDAQGNDFFARKSAFFRRTFASFLFLFDFFVDFRFVFRSDFDAKFG